MRIKVLRNLGPEFTRYKENQVVDASDAEAERLIAMKLAVPVDDDEELTTDEELRAVPRSASIGRAKSDPGTVERATEDLKEYKDKASRRASANSATPETIQKNPHEPAK